MVKETDKIEKLIRKKISRSLSEEVFDSIYRSLKLMKKRFEDRPPNSQLKFEKVAEEYIEQLRPLTFAKPVTDLGSLFEFVLRALAIVELLAEKKEKLASKSLPSPADAWLISLICELSRRIDGTKKYKIRPLATSVFERNQDAKAKQAVHWHKLVANGLFLSGRDGGNNYELNLRKRAERIQKRWPDFWNHCKSDTTSLEFYLKGPEKFRLPILS